MSLIKRDCHAQLHAISVSIMRDLKSYGGGGLTKPDNDNILYFPNIKIYI